MTFRTISSKCPRCGYLRYELLHTNDGCSGLLLKNSHGYVHCKLCDQNMSNEVQVTCPFCGHKRTIDLINLESSYNYSIVKMEYYETIIIFE